MRRRIPVFYLALVGCLSLVALAGHLTSTALHGSTRVAARMPGAGAGHARAAAPATASGSSRKGRILAAAGTAAAPRLAFSVAKLPGSAGASEPSLALDSTGAIYVTAPTGLGHDRTTTSASPLWKSGDGGATWSGPTSTETQGQTATGIGGGDSDILVDRSDNVFVASLWGGNTGMGVSTDHGATFTTVPIGHTTPVDDRPWLAYDPNAGALYMAWDGAGALHVGKALLGTTVSGESVPNPAGAPGQLVFAQDVPVVDNEPDRGCTACAPGTIAVDPAGHVSVAFAGPSGVGVATSTDGGRTWGTPDYVPSSSTADHSTWGSASNSFQVLRSDSQGNLYLVWSQVVDTAGTVAVFLTYQKSGTAAWHTPIQVSTTAGALFGTLAVVSPGNVDVAYYGTSAAGDPNSAPGGTKWDLELAKVQGLFDAPSTVTTDVMPGFHTGTICTAGLSCKTSSADRSLGDFFSIAVDGAGLADVVTTVDGAAGTSTLEFVHEDAPPPAPALTAGTVLTVPPPQMGDAAQPRQLTPPSFSSGAGAAAPTPDTGAATADPAPAPDPTTNGGDRSSSPKYPSGVAMTTMPAQGGAGGSPLGLPLWAYGLGGGGATAGRMLLRRMH